MSLVYDRKILPFRQIESYSIVHIKERRFFLNDAGTKIWNLVDGKTTAENIALHLIKELSIPVSATASVQNRVELFLSDLFKKGLLILLQGSSSSDDQGQ